MPSWLITVVLQLWDQAPSCSAGVKRGIERNDVDLGHRHYDIPRPRDTALSKLTQPLAAVANWESTSRAPDDSPAP
jgi:hypothetical protein